MNERTKQLWEESQQWNGSDDGRGGLKILESVDKFAKLIVEQCAGIIESQDVDPSFKLRMSWAVKQYFGVEE